MSFDIFVTAYKAGEPATIPRTLVETTLGPLKPAPGAGFYNLPFQSLAELQMDDSDAVDGFMISRPPLGSMEFCAALLKLLQQTPTVLYWPGDGCIVGNAAVVLEMPGEMIETLGKPVLVASPEEIPRIIENSGA